MKPGGRVSALLKIQRFDHNERVTFDLEDWGEIERLIEVSQ